ncbi:hypothetical protein ACROYT_G016249 [Oculina patagonica]
MTASSFVNSSYQPAYGRLNFNEADGWCASTPSRNDEWLQVDLGELYDVCGIATQGDSQYDGADEWVTAFKLSYSQDGMTWTAYKDENGDDVEFHRNGGSNTVDLHEVNPISARYIRFNPTERQGWNCLRVEVYRKIPLGSSPQMPAESCAEIDAIEEGRAVSGNYWLASETFPVYCDMTSESKGWTLIARFSNTDARNWMEDSDGYWWYDITEATGETTDPSIKKDMISPAFWMTSGNEFKITRSNDTQHTPLLQTTSGCLGGKTFRSKITSYGDFRNGSQWVRDQCLGNCAVEYGGQYQDTIGFEQAQCNGTIQSSNKIGFWCNKGWSSTVMMIGGGGEECKAAGHGVGVTAAKSPHFVTESGRRKTDFANWEWGHVFRGYALNLWVR